MGKVLNKLTEIAEDINSEPAVFILKAAVMYPTAAIISVVTAMLVPLSLNILRICKELQARQVSVNDVAPEPMDTPRKVTIKLTLGNLGMNNH
ncbi:NAD(P)-binding protein [Penicillium longicatenatum]|uniref:NAD(P)-binding protein n=1 Tax=Penicillium longicatenatum TaxID=1561947 RepID=UPI002547A5E4|nr:NAD(P)-binding protein [Penicillium longicatenatum]KAJ5640238.1 NAD(P)-binding protein [Penicillium longicatenatum]